MSFDPAVIARVAAIVAAVLYLGLVAFQLALALGAPWGRAAYGGQSAELSTALRVSSAIAVIVWSGVALVVLRRAGVTGWAPLPDAWLPVAVWVVVGLSAVAIVMNAITPSALERAIWLPVAILLFGSTLTVALAAPR
ncbi:hypothetical protein [Protaetiibacter intestinalis]|uniref:Uncharacterized protein n=1 Tax=Protaetiibacter intestinalis TaxID=2419774 RepID=A0A387BGT1_9MICO|nr:hypothetical protein [Protaetiibacter intestinalis]AYF97720.1 hypothetical protein D7I47_05275 [Protaetiibacter intestinalis]